jgi:hypothetical protein
MASDPLLTTLLGPGCTQDLQSIKIQKADLIPPPGLNPSYEFIPTESNGSESIFLAIFLKAQRNQDKSLDSQLVITPFEMSLEYRFNKWQRKYSCTVEVFVDDVVSTFPNPNLI